MSSRDPVFKVMDALLRIDRDMGPEAMHAAARQALLSIARIRIEAVLRRPPKIPASDNVISLDRFRREHRTSR